MHRHPSFCVNRSPLPCGYHLAEPTIVAATGDGRPVATEIAAAVTYDGWPGVAITLVDAETETAVTGVLRLAELAAAMAAMTAHGHTAGDERAWR
jgi:hypothetical protein